MNKSVASRFAAAGLLGIALLASSAFAADAGFWSYPAISGYGPVHVWPHVVLKPKRDTTYKAVFDVTKPSPAPEKLSPALNHVARAVNVFAAAGISLQHLRFVIIVHGPATADILDNQAYRARFHVDNPNLALIAALHKAGVRLLVCGNALADLKFKPSEVDPQVKVALSALSTLVILQDQGYALLSM